MCSLCGVMGGAEHWTSGSGRLDAAVTGTRRAERLQRVRIANGILALFALRLEDWQGSTFILASATGWREIVDALPAVWDVAGRMLGRPIDPLDPVLLERLDG